MWTVVQKNDGCQVHYNDNGPELATWVPNSEIKALRAAYEGETEPETCPALQASFTAHNDWDSVAFTLANDSDLAMDELWLIDAVACVYYRDLLAN